MSWREEARKDRTAAAADRRADMAARAEQVRANAVTAANLRRAEQDARAARSAARRAAIAQWFKANVLELLFVPVIVVPALLAWPAMAAYGTEIFGPPGVLLPGFTEGAMWAFAFAVGMARQQQRSTWALQLGVWVCAFMAAGMNFLHGLTVGGPAAVVTGVVMAVVSVGGVIVHQLITARPRGPRKSRAERAAERIARRADRRIAAVRHAAVRQAVADLALDGTARLVYQPGMVTLTRSWLGRRRLDTTIGPGLPPAQVVHEPPAVPVHEPAPVEVREPARSVSTKSRKPARRKTAVKPRRVTYAEYLNKARRALTPGVMPTPKWAQDTTGCSAGTSVKLARDLRAELPTTTDTDTVPAETERAA